MESTFEDALSVMAGDVLRAKLQRPGGTSSDAALAVGGRDAAFHNFYAKNWVLRP